MRMRPDPTTGSGHYRRTLLTVLTTAADHADGLAAAAQDLDEARDLSDFASRLMRTAEMRMVELEQSAPVTSRVLLPYPPDAAKVADELDHALAHLYRLAGWDVALMVNVLADGIHIRIDSAGYLDAAPWLVRADEAVFAVGVLTDPDTLSDIGTLADLRRAETTDEGRLLVSGRIAELILDCLPEPVGNETPEVA